MFIEITVFITQQHNIERWIPGEFTVNVELLRHCVSLLDTNIGFVIYFAQLYRKNDYMMLLFLLGKVMSVVWGHDVCLSSISIAPQIIFQLVRHGGL